MIKNIILATVAMSLAGCAATQVTRPGTAPSQTQRDIAECTYEGNKASPMNAIIARQIAVQCLKLRGYRVGS